MLMWALFTLGYLFGVFFALAVFLKKDVVNGIAETDNAVLLRETRNRTSWEGFAQLTKINYSKKKLNSKRKLGHEVGHKPAFISS